MSGILTDRDEEGRRGQEMQCGSVQPKSGAHEGGDIQ